MGVVRWVSVPFSVYVSSLNADILLSCNLGAPRFIPKQHTSGVKVHRTVKSRMEAAPPNGQKKRYSPKARLAIEPTWID